MGMRKVYHLVVYFESETIKECAGTLRKFAEFVEPGDFSLEVG